MESQQAGWWMRITLSLISYGESQDTNLMPVIQQVVKSFQL